MYRLLVILFSIICTTLPILAEPANQAPAEIPTDLVPLQPEIEAQFAFLCLNDTKQATDEAIKAALVRWFKLKSTHEIIAFNHKVETDTISWAIGKSRFVAALSSYPIPASDIQYAANNSRLHWPDAEKIMLTHKAHYTINCTSRHAKPWQAALDLTHAIAAFAEIHNSTGIYWGDASILHQPKTFLNDARYEPGSALPAALWVGILIEPHAKNQTVSIYTDGMPALGQQEIEIHHAKVNQQDLYALMLSLTQDVLDGKVTLEPGKTITAPNKQIFSIGKAESAIKEKSSVWLLSPIKN